MFAYQDTFLISSLLERALRLWLGKGCERVLVLSGLLPLRNFSQFSRLPSKVARFVFSPLRHCLNSSKECCIQRKDIFPSKIFNLLRFVNCCLQFNDHFMIMHCNCCKCIQFFPIVDFVLRVWLAHVSWKTHMWLNCVTNTLVTEHKQSYLFWSLTSIVFPFLKLWNFIDSMNVVYDYVWTFECINSTLNFILTWKFVSLCSTRKQSNFLFQYNMKISSDQNLFSGERKIV